MPMNKPFSARRVAGRKIASPDSADWRRGASIYQVYPRSFFDSNGDGIGDLPGVAAKLDHIASLGVDAIWLSPFYTSPMADFGYDVADHTAVDPIFGVMADFDLLVAKAKALGLRIIVDLVVGHTSDAHEWFRDSRRARTAEKADWYVWADSKPDGSAPNNWLSVFSGPAWAWEPRRRQYYLHHFLKEQPSLNIRNPEVRAALIDVAAFWIERGVSGLRLDAIDFLAHDPLMRDNEASGLDPAQAPPKLFGMQVHRHDMLHSDGMVFLHELRALADRESVMLLGEVSSQPGAFERIAAYTGPGGPLHTAYTLAPMRGDFDHESASGFVRSAARSDASICWAFSNHDTMRAATRWRLREGEDDRKLRLVGAFQMALRGEICLYQGDELGLTEADLRHSQLRDPFGLAFWPEFKGRDGSRTPMPWRADAHATGFSDGEPWLPVAAGHEALAVETQEQSPDSILAHWRALVAWRQRTPEIRNGSCAPLDLPAPIVGFIRATGERRTVCLFNLSEQPARVRVGERAYALEPWGYALRSERVRAKAELALA